MLNKIPKFTKEMFEKFVFTMNADIQTGASPTIKSHVIRITDRYAGKSMFANGEPTTAAKNMVMDFFVVAYDTVDKDVKKFVFNALMKSGIYAIPKEKEDETTTEDDGSSETSKHYKSFGRVEEQPIVVMMRSIPRKDFSAYLECSFMKYNMRNGKKSGTNDTGKAMQYAKWYFEFKRNFGITVDGQFVRA